mmetsp:Transcript_20876/g.45745  ORF Transcript_20876/g.45745 Transcript_20876/m.45745 type:complete len:257 (-) Transcript_20876:277-1047(-)|eukprot:CAMPEP_0118925718 /NCGR_PEP_ID=MMETSP1169-20130426/3558_1 /TAXON_ID=36882 /ORGANISM="Pyramimonas obovata, Strain CCMP722" /LENGTH=256 /DNA_ID=CAMNT_0006867097 /DNA_START=269 /DNA_END=1039 /DNA_ORIENTATION=-
MAKFEPPSWAGKPTPSTLFKVQSSEGGGEHQEDIRLDEKSYYVFGRTKESCDVVLDHGSASRMHAAIVHHTNGRLYIIDLGATQGTTVDGKKLVTHKPVQLVDGSKIKFGHIPKYYRTSIGSKKRKPGDQHADSPDKKAKQDDMVRCSHLLVKHKDSRRPSSHKEAVITRTKEEAVEMVARFLEEIKSSADVAATFGELAERESHCSSSKRKGDLGPFGRGKMQPIFEKAAYALKVGELSGVVCTDSGAHILYRTG